MEPTANPRPGVAGTPLGSCSVQVERKLFTFDLRENDRGRFLRIVEDVNGRRDVVIVPAPGIESFRDALNEIIKVNQSLPPKP